MMPNKPIRSASHRLTNDVVFKVVCDSVGPEAKILDFGSGVGHMCQRLGDHFEVAGHDPADHIFACEINPSEFLYDRIKSYCGHHLTVISIFPAPEGCQ